MGIFGKIFGRHHGGGHHGSGYVSGGPTAGWRVNSGNNCPNCKSPNGSGSRFCQQCGTSLLPTVCMQCGSALQPGAKFCDQCGKAAS